jgi:hypothetical protein
MTAISRRRIMQLLGAALAAAAVVPEVADRARVEPPRSTWDGKTRWIGHC